MRSSRPSESPGNATPDRAATYPEMDDNGRRFRIVPNTGPGGGPYIRDYEPHATPSTMRLALRADGTTTGSRPRMADARATSNRGTRVLAAYRATRDLTLGEASAIEHAMLRAAVITQRKLDERKAAS
jgi:hypothetical protein